MRGFSICLYLMSIGCNVLANSDTESVTISGISAGAFMASQFHVAFSSRVHGVGMLAGGPYYCAMDDVALAEERCSKLMYIYIYLALIVHVKDIYRFFLKEMLCIF